MPLFYSFHLLYGLIYAFQCGVLELPFIPILFEFDQPLPPGLPFLLNRAKAP